MNFKPEVERLFNTREIARYTCTHNRQTMLTRQPGSTYITHHLVTYYTHLMPVFNPMFLDTHYLGQLHYVISINREREIFQIFARLIELYVTQNPRHVTLQTIVGTFLNCCVFYTPPGRFFKLEVR